MMDKLIKNGLIFDAVHKEPYTADILIQDGKFAAIGEKLSAENAEVIDASGKHIYPGFVDAHSHIGLDDTGIGFEGQDYNELNDILTPQLRAIDGFYPQDPALKEAALAGVTTVCTGPGSSNVVGGVFMAVKTVGDRVDKMVINDHVAMKCAFGENPKRCYKDKNNYCRMSTAAKLRELILKTLEYDRLKQAAGDDPTKQPKFDFKLESMLPVVHKEIPLKAHAHRADDIFTAIRIAKEFDLKLTLEHVTEGHLIVDDLIEEDYPMAVGPSMSNASKFELRNKTFATPGILAKAGGRVSIITDAPVTPEQYLPLCAELAIKSGMEEFAALQAITINAARHIGVEDRVGSIEEGKDADLVIMPGTCFDIALAPDLVLINGEKVDK
ncbi:MAG: amidohydrolase [Candidatus Faecivivens sp.]|nr:amidohydrolase [Candidatus Faecivivens sp.]